MPDTDSAGPSAEKRTLEQRIRGALNAAFGEFHWTPPPWLGAKPGGARPSEAGPAGPAGSAGPEPGPDLAVRPAPGKMDYLDAELRRELKKAADWLREQAARDPKRFYGMATLCLAAAVLALAGVRWYIHRPKVVKFAVSCVPPGPTRMADVIKYEPLHIDFDGSSARLDLVGKAFSRGISVNPPIPGEWRWVSDRRITFSPKVDWAIGHDYVVRLDRSLFGPRVRLQKYEVRFRSAAFASAIAAAEFYQDPVNPKLKKVVTTLSFTHPIDPAELEKRVFLRLAGKESGFLGLGAKSYPFTVLYNKFKTEAYIHSDPVDIPPDDTYMAVSVEGGLRAARGGPAVEAKLERQVPIPGMFNYFRIQSAELAVARNERYEPERVLVVQATAGALESEIRKNLEAYELPVDLPALQGQPAVPNYHYSDPAKIGPEILSAGRRLQLEPLPTDKEYATQHSFKYQASAGRYVYVRLRKGIKSYGDYVLAKDFDQVSRVPDLPKELKIMGDGAVLSLGGDKKVSIVARDLDAVRFELGRVLPGQVNHLVSQSDGLFKDPEFGCRFGPENISERFTETRVLKREESGRTQYFSFDLAPHLADPGEGGWRRGLFFLKVEGWDPVKDRPTGISDKRLILVTDLGMLVKDVQDGGHEVFVQSIREGSPLAGVQVQIIGKNGVAVVSATTDEDGHVSFPPMKGLEREKTPTAYLLRRGGDLSFLPYGWSDRRLNLSRFDVGGARSFGNPERLQAYLFSDRGIYRPGDEFHVGLIVKPADWKESLAGVPLEAVVTDARGLEVYKSKLILGAHGFEELRYKTDDTSPTGAWQASVYIVKDGRRSSLLGSVPVRVEEFLPDRLRITTRLSAERLDGWVSPKDLKARVTLKNLFGTSASGRKVRASLTLSPSYPAFHAFPDYSFFDPQQAKHSFSERLEDRQTDGDGEAEYALDLGRFEKATYRLSFAAEGFEAEGGRGVSSESSVLVSLRDYLLGYKADGDLRYISKDASRSVHLLAVDPALAKRAVDGLTAQVLEQRYVSVLVRQPNGTYQYESVLKELPVSKKPLSIPADGLSYALPTAQPGDYALSLRDAEDTELLRVHFSVAGRGNLSRSLEKNAELKVLLDKADVSPSQEIEVQITAPYAGAGLITIERDRVYAHKWFKSSTTGSVHRIRVPADMEGNGYVVVTFVRSADSPEIFMSPLSYGVAPFSISRRQRTNEITLDSPDLARPGEPYRIRYRTEKPGKIVIFAVDEGILQVAGYRTPDPLARFFEKRALEVHTAQILDLILPEFRLVQELSAPGGDEGRQALGQNLNPFKRKRDKPAAYWSGIVDAGPGEREVEYAVPDTFNGSLRVMAVAVSDDSVGVAQKKALVRGHFVITPNAPSVTAPGDEFEVSVGLANLAAGSGKDAQVALEAKASDELEVLGPASRTLPVAEGREATAVYKVKVRDRLGSATLSFTAKLGDKSSKCSTDVSVRPAVPYMTTVASGRLKTGKAEVAVPRRMYPHYRTLEVSASSLPMGLARGLLAYLEKFPYGCTEQLVSQAFPAVVLRGRREFGASIKDADATLERALGVLRARQNQDGAFGMWAANSHVSDLQTVYALHFLTDAKEKGFPVPADVLQRGLAYLGTLAGGEPESLDDARVRVYAAYVLARNGSVVSGPLLTLRKRLDERFPKAWKKDLAGIYAAGVYKLLKQDPQAERLIAESRLGDPQQVDYDCLYDGLARDSQLLYVLARHFPERLKRLTGDDISRIADPIGQGRFNTMSSAYAILGLSAYADAVETPAMGSIQVSQALAGGSVKPLTMPAGLFPKAAFSPEAQSIRLAAAGQPVYYQVVAAGFDTGLPGQPLLEKIEVQREYRDAGGKAVTHADLGSELEVHVKARTLDGSNLANVALVDLLPGGFEVVMDSARGAEEEARAQAGRPEAGEGEVEAVAEGEAVPAGEAAEGGDEPAVRQEDQGDLQDALNSQTTWRADYVDIREDRVVVFGSVGPDASEFVYRIRATNRGKFVIPPIYGESMYDRSVRGRGLAGTMTVEGR